MQISTLIVTKERPHALKMCVGSLAESSRRPDEIVIIDGSREKNTDIPKEVVRMGAPIIYKRIPGIGLAQARNLAVQTATYATVLFLDDDCSIFPDAIALIEKGMKRARVDSIIGVVVNGKSHNIYSCVQQAYYDLWIIQASKNHMIPGLDIAAFRKKTLLKAPFSEDLPFGLDEDIELGARLIMEGAAWHFDPKIRAYHDGRSSFIALAKRNASTGYANEYLRSKFAINTRKEAGQISFMQKISAARRNSRGIGGFQKGLFWIVFFMYPIFSGIGRWTFRVFRGWFTIRMHHGHSV